MQWPKRTRGSVDWACVALISFCFEETLYRTFHMCFLPNLVHFATRFQRKRFFNKSTNRKQKLPEAAMFGSDRDKISDLHRGPSIDASNQVSVHLEKRIREEFFRNRPTGNNNCMWRPCLLTDRDNTGSRYRWHSIDDFHQVLVHLAKRFQRRRFFRDRLIINKNCL